MKITFKKIFQVVQEGESINAIIAYHKIPVEFEHKDMGNGLGKTEVIKWAKFLRIDLWILSITFNH